MKIIPIIGFKKELVKESIKKFTVEFAYQNVQKGTAHAIEQCLVQLKNFEGNVLILSGDVPLISQLTLMNLIDTHNKNHSLGSLEKTYNSNQKVVLLCFDIVYSYNQEPKVKSYFVYFLPTLPLLVSSRNKKPSFHI